MIPAGHSRGRLTPREPRPAQSPPPRRGTRRDLADDLRLAVNVSPSQFKSGTLPLKAASELAAAGLAASRLELEITEAVLIRDHETALAILHQLRALGMRIALDDFGTGYSLLSYPQRFRSTRSRSTAASSIASRKRRGHRVSCRPCWTLPPRAT
jgi:hypothetical protein